MSTFSISEEPPALSCTQVSGNSSKWKPGEVKVVGKRCGCGLSFCPTCGKTAVRRGLSRLTVMDWRKVRAVELTLDPSRYPDPFLAYKAMGKEIGYFIASLKTHGVDVRDWVAFLEWHASGLPHYHLYIDVGKVGAAGMIGYEKIKSLWTHGLVREWPIRSERHWQNLIGYAAKTGYLHKAKRHQVVYPEWALKSRVRIRRVHGQQKREDKATVRYDESLLVDWIAKYKLATPEDLDSEWAGENNPVPMTNGERLSKCSECVYIYYATRGMLVHYQGKIKLSFADFKGLGAVYQEGLGWTIRMPAGALLDFHNKYFKGDMKR